MNTLEHSCRRDPASSPALSTAADDRDAVAQARLQPRAGSRSPIAPNTAGAGTRRRRSSKDGRREGRLGKGDQRASAAPLGGTSGPASVKSATFDAHSSPADPRCESTELQCITVKLEVAVREQGVGRSRRSGADARARSGRTWRVSAAPSSSSTGDRTRRRSSVRLARRSQEHLDRALDLLLHFREPLARRRAVEAGVDLHDAVLAVEEERRRIALPALQRKRSRARRARLSSCPRGGSDASFRSARRTASPAGGCAPRRPCTRTRATRPRDPCGPYFSSRSRRNGASSAQFGHHVPMNATSIGFPAKRASDVDTIRPSTSGNETTYGAVGVLRLHDVEGARQERAPRRPRRAASRARTTGGFVRERYSPASVPSGSSSASKR